MKAHIIINNDHAHFPALLPDADIESDRRYTNLICMECRKCDMWSVVAERYSLPDSSSGVSSGMWGSNPGRGHLCP